jgi:hypothetical protein
MEQWAENKRAAMCAQGGSSVNVLWPNNHDDQKITASFFF